MYISSWTSPVPGIEPRIPTVFGCAVVLHTSIVDHSKEGEGLGSGVAASAIAGVIARREFRCARTHDSAAVGMGRRRDP